MRVISVESLLLLAELKYQYIHHEDILSILRPSIPRVDPIIDVMTKLLASSQPVMKEMAEEVAEIAEDVNYFLTPAKGDEKNTAEEIVNFLVGDKKVWGFGERTPHRETLKPGDKICFYASGKGVVAHAEVATKPEKVKEPEIEILKGYPWVSKLKNVKLYLDTPVILDSVLRSKLDAFKDRDLDAWGWFVITTQKISKHDFELLTRQ